MHTFLALFPLMAMKQMKQMNSAKREGFPYLSYLPSLLSELSPESRLLMAGEHIRRSFAEHHGRRRGAEGKKKW